MQRKNKYLTYRFKCHTVSEAKFFSTRRSRPNPILIGRVTGKPRKSIMKTVFKLKYLKSLSIKINYSLKLIV